ncbi:MAG: FAD-dependent oxidoreductase [Rhizobiaceae bacterium]|nr:FAD-dependent oxidoreductase [Rhizobiaceae bacterium]
MEHISIIGSGVAGLCIARTLLDHGAKLRLFERGEGIGSHACSWWAGGMLAPYCENESAEEPVLRLGKESADWWEKHTGQVHYNGTLVVSLERDHSDLRRFKRRTENFIDVGPDEITRLEPDLGDRFTKGLYFENEAHLSPRTALVSLRDKLVLDGVEFIHEEVDPAVISADGLTIDCRGFAAKDALADLRGVKGEMVILSAPDIELSRPVRLLHPRIPLYVVPRGDGVFMLGATMLESSTRSRISARSLLELLSAAYALNPAFGEAEILEIGVDSRPAFPDNLPRIQREGNLIHVNGLYRHGFLLAPAMARMVAELIFDNSIPEMMHEHFN